VSCQLNGTAVARPAWSVANISLALLNSCLEPLDRTAGQYTVRNLAADVEAAAAAVGARSPWLDAWLIELDRRLSKAFFKVGSCSVQSKNCQRCPATGSDNVVCGERATLLSQGYVQPGHASHCLIICPSLHGAGCALDGTP
jgi:hypothetical protein